MGTKTGVFLGTAAALLICSGASAQVTSYKSNNQPLMKGDPNTVVCKKEETIGTRLGGRKLCLTIAEWNEKAREHREFADDIQSGARTDRSDDPPSAMQSLGGGPQ